MNYSKPLRNTLGPGVPGAAPLKFLGTIDPISAREMTAAIEKAENASTPTNGPPPYRPLISTRNETSRPFSTSVT